MKKIEKPIRMLLMYHCKANTGYAIGTLERAFWNMALRISGKKENIFLCYSSYSDGLPEYVPPAYDNFYELDPREKESSELEKFQDFLSSNNINVIFGFDQPPNLPYYRRARKAGVKVIASYWGAPMSSINTGLKLLIKKLELMLYRFDPDVYIFESEAMRQSAYKGRGVPRENTIVCYLGVDTETFTPDLSDSYYAHDALGIDRGQKLIFYSGHFEPRKGVAIIMEAANFLASSRNDITFILFGNKSGEESPYQKQLSEIARKQVVFGGYRSDLNRIHRSCFLGVIASTGWDSFTMSAIEMQASGLPLFVSDLPGLNETVDSPSTGKVFPSGDYKRLANLILELADDSQERESMSKAARRRAQSTFSLETQIDALTCTIRSEIQTKIR